MDPKAPPYEKVVFVCVNERAEGISCGPHGGKDLAETLKDAVRSAGASHRIRVSRTYCLGLCSQGPNVLVEPDHLVFSHVSPAQVPSILEKLGIRP